MWSPYLTNIVRTVLTFFVILNKGYSGLTVLSDCHVTINVSAWSLHGSCLVSSTSDQYQCYWILKEKRGQHVVLNTFCNKTNRDQNTGLTGICSFMFSMPKQEGEYRYFILSKPEPANNYSFDMIINGTDEGGIVDYTFWVDNGVEFGRFTCNASSYFQDVLYIWTIPCQNELIRDKTSECSTSLTDRKEEITCIAINASTSMNVFHEGSSQHPKKELPRSVLIGCTVGMFGIMSLSVAIAIYLKRRKGAGHCRTTEYSTEDVIRNSTSTSTRVNNVSDLTQEEHPGSSLDFYTTSDNSTIRRQEWDSGQTTHLKLSTMIKKPVETSVLREERETAEESVNFDSSCSNSEYENIDTHSTPKATDAVDFRRRESSKKSQEETRPQSDSDATLYNRLSFFTHRRPLSGPTQLDSPYNHLDHH
ncbi:uncharacterized protein LOC112567763 [Pomacea canaliculata]|uniref:uncharacterized protein LOC112567763 n=1 Tax=Pomacea canaliculata TaxID=400727 RepID=UPI000D73F1C3|nr:uncharacterized protein LOC112567763 [Pomacea canaliculata]